MVDLIGGDVVCEAELQTFVVLAKSQVAHYVEKHDRDIDQVTIYKGSHGKLHPVIAEDWLQQDKGWEDHEDEY